MFYDQCFTTYVSDECIQDGHAESSKFCPVALSLSNDVPKHLKGDSYTGIVSSSNITFESYHQIKGVKGEVLVTFDFSMDDEIRQFVSDFDKGNSVSEFDIEYKVQSVDTSQMRDGYIDVYGVATIQ